MGFPVEPIPDADTVSRAVEFPTQYTNDRGLIWHMLFQFPSGVCESLIWRKYANSDNEVHEIGEEIAAEKRSRKPDRQYEGFVYGVVARIRSIRTFRGHGFTVSHQPEDGRQHHAQVCYDPAGENNLKPADKTELKDAIRACFSDLVPKPEQT